MNVRAGEEVRTRGSRTFERGMPRRLPLWVWLTLLSLLLVLLVAAGLVPAGLVLLERLATENARARVQLAAVGALEALQRLIDAALTSARLLAERPTLLRFVETADQVELDRFLDRFHATAGLDGCAVAVGGALVAAVPRDLPWEALGPFDGLDAGTARSVRDPRTGETALVVASMPLVDHPEGRALVVRRLDDSVRGPLEEQVGLPLQILVAAREPEDPAPFLTGDAWRARRFLTGDGASVGVEVALPVAEVARSQAPLRRSYAIVTVLAAAMAVAAGVLAARRISRPFHVLGEAARRIGSGDLGTPVPRAPGSDADSLAATMEDMRQRLRAAAAELHQREAEARALLEGIVEGVFSVDGARRLRYLNHQATALLGVAAEDAIGRFCGDVLRPLELDGARPCETSCPIVHARSRGSSRSTEHLQLANGRRTVVVTSAPPAGPHQVQVLRDETEIEAARRSRDAVLANVSHELRTPLSAQLASLELLQSEMAEMEPSPAMDLVASLERSTLRLTRLIDNLLESVRIETGQAALRRVPVEIAAVLEEARALTEPLLIQRRQRLELDLPASEESNWWVDGDPVQLTQVFVNLLANANKFAPDGTAIGVGGASGERSVAVWVEDAGPGVQPADVDSVFDRFHRGGAGTEGMGLGLWIVKSIVERHGGTIGVTDSPAGGARFTVTLPWSELG